MFWIVILILSASLVYCLWLLDKALLRMDYLESCLSVLEKQNYIEGEN